MKLIFKKIKQALAQKKDSESEFLYFVLRLITYSTTLVILPPINYYVKLIHFNDSVVCSQYVDFNLNLSADTLFLLHRSLIIFLVCSAIGLFSQISALISFGLFTVLTVHTLSSCYANHAFFPVGLVLLIWCINNQATKYSVDHWVASQLFKKTKVQQKFTSSIFIYLRLHFALVFTFAGLTKLRMGGLGWFLSDNLSNRMALQNFLQNRPTIDWPYLKTLNHFVIETPHLAQVLGFIVITIELSMFSLAFIKNRRLQILLVLLMAFLQINFYMIMYINFYPWVVLYLVWIVTFLEKPLNAFQNHLSQPKKNEQQPKAIARF